MEVATSLIKSLLQEPRTEDKKVYSTSTHLLSEQTHIHASNTDTAIIQIAPHHPLLSYTNGNRADTLYLPTNRVTMLIKSILAEITSLTHI